MKRPKPISSETAKLWQQMQQMAAPYIRRDNFSDDPQEQEQMELDPDNFVQKAQATWEYDQDPDEYYNNRRKERRQKRLRPRRENYNDLENSFGAKRFLHNPSNNMYVQISKANLQPKKIYSKRNTTAADNPWDLLVDDDGNFSSDSVGYDETGYNFEPSRAKQKHKLERVSKGRGSRRPLMMPGESRLEKPGEDHDTDDFAPGELVRGQDKKPILSPEKPLRRAWIYGKQAKDIDGDGKADSTKIRDKITPEDKLAFERMSPDELGKLIEPGGTKMAREFVNGAQHDNDEQDDQLVTVTKSQADKELIVEMMSAKFGYNPRTSIDKIQSIQKSNANLHAIEHGSIFELHQNKSGDYIISPIGYGSVGDLALPVPSEYASVFETDVAKAKMRADIEQKMEMRKSFTEVDSQYFYRSEIDKLLAKSYRMIQSWQKAMREPNFTSSETSTLHAADDPYTTSEARDAAYQRANQVRRTASQRMSSEPSYTPEETSTLHAADDPYTTSEARDAAYQRANQVRRNTRNPMNKTWDKNVNEDSDDNFNNMPRQPRNNRNAERQYEKPENDFPRNNGAAPWGRNPDGKHPPERGVHLNRAPRFARNNQNRDARNIDKLDNNNNKW